MGGGLNKQGGLENSVKYNKRGGWNRRGFFLFIFCFDPNDIKCIKNCLCTNKIVINGKGKKC